MKHRLFFLFALACSGLHAQDTTNSFHRLGIAIGGQQTHLLDQQFSPLIYSASEISAKLFYEAEHGHSDWNASFAFSRGALFPSQFADRKIYNTTEDIYGNTTVDSVFIRGNTLTAQLQFGYAHDVFHTEKWALNLGASLREQFMYPSTFTNVGTMNAVSLLATAGVHYYLNPKNEFAANLNFPVIGFNSRFPYSGTVSQPNEGLVAAFFDGGTRFVSLNHFQQVNVMLGYRYSLSDRWAVGAQYEFQWLHDDLPLSFKLYSNRLAASVDYNF